MRARRAQGGHELSPNARQAALSCSSFASPAAAANSSMGYAFGHVPGRSDADPNNLVVLIPFFGFIIAGGVFLYRWLKKKKFSDLKIAIVLWYWFDACTHLILEHAFVLLSLFGPNVPIANLFLDAWREYGLCDRRWAFQFDTCVVSLEILTVYVDGLLAAAAIYAIIKKKRWLHFVQIVLCVAELYGGWMTFAPEWLTGNENLTASGFVHFWVYLVFMNVVWVIIPGLLLYQSYLALDLAFRKQTKKLSRSPARGRSPARTTSPARVKAE